MLLTAPGKVVASNQRSVAGPPATGLGIDLVAAVATVFKARSKDEKAAMWGKVSQEETIGYVLADLLGYPVIDAGEARTLGDPVRKRSNAAEQQEKADLKEARRRPAGPARDQAVAVASAAVRNPVMRDLPLPAVRGKTKLSASVMRALPSVPVSAADPAPASAPAPKHGPTSRRFTEAMARRRAQLRREYCNVVCTCAEHGQPFHNVQAGVKSPDFVEHSMFCRMWHCYAYEARCCEVIVGDTVDTMHIGAPCECIEGAFDPYADDMRSENARYVRGHVDEYGKPDRPCRYGGELTCHCCGCYGRYVPTCPYRQHAVTGEIRGDDWYEMQGERRGEWRSAETREVWKDGVWQIYPPPRAAAS